MTQLPTYDFFIASRWRNQPAVMELTTKLRAKGKTVYCFFESEFVADRATTDPEQAMATFEQRDWQTDPHVKDIFESDLAAEKNSATLILLLPAGKSAHLEAGIAYGWGKKCILIGEQTAAESVYLLFHETYGSIDEFLERI